MGLELLLKKRNPRGQHSELKGKNILSGSRNDELMLTRAEVLCRELEKPAVPRRGVHSVCSLGGPDRFEGCGISAEIRHGKSTDLSDFFIS